MTHSKYKYIAIIVALCFAALIIELACFAFFSFAKDRFSFYEPEKLVLSPKKLARAQKAYDYDIGWKHVFDTPYGERPRPRNYPESIMATFGDSYTYGDQVAHNHSFQSFLSRRLRANVYNFGVPGSGTDQAYLRFKRDYPKVKTPIVALGLITENINRIVNVYRKFYYPKTSLSISKPRFQLEDDKLVLIPNPIKSKEELDKLSDINFIKSLGKNDLWYQRDKHPFFDFPYSGILFNKRIWLEAVYGRGNKVIDDLDPRPWESLWEDAETVKLLFAILDSFISEARTMGARPIIILFPRKNEVYKKYDKSPLMEAEKLLDFCKERSFLCFDGISALAASVASKGEIKSLYLGHLTPKGNRLMAKHFYSFLKKERLL